MSQTSLVLMTLVLYKVVLILIGFWAQRRNHSNEDYFLGGRKLGPLVAGISYGASAASAWTFLGLSGAAFVLGISALWISLGTILCMCLAWIWMAPRMMRESHKHKLITLTDYLALGADGAVRKVIVRLAAFVIVISLIFYVAAQFQGSGQTFSVTFDMSADTSIALGAAIILVYTILGGFWAVSVTDTLQGLLMMGAAILLPVTAVVSLGGFGAFIDSLLAVSTPEQLSLTAGNVGLTAVGFLFGLLTIGTGIFGQPHLVTRLMALRDEKALRQGRIISISWYATVFVGVVILGLCGHIMLPDIDNPENIFFAMTDTLFSTVISAILLAAILSAIMSTADSQLLAVASVLSHDLGLSRLLPGREILVSRIVITLVSITAASVAIFLPEAIFTRVVFAWNAIGAAFGPVIILRLCGLNLPPWSVVTSIAVGFFSTVIIYLLPDTPGDFAERIIPFVGCFIILLVSARKKQPAPLSERRTADA